MPYPSCPGAWFSCPSKGNCGLWRHLWSLLGSLCVSWWISSLQSYTCSERKQNHWSDQAPHLYKRKGGGMIHQNCCQIYIFNQHLLEKCFKHVCFNLLGPGSINFVHLFSVRIISIQTTKLAFSISEKK